jgi:nicotinamidase-related amidase
VTEKKSKAFIVVDPLRRFSADEAPFLVKDAAEIIAGINEIARSFRSKDLPVVWMSRLIRPQMSLGARTAEKYAGLSSAFLGEWAELDERLEILEQDYLIYKPRHSSFYSTDLDIILKENAVDEVWLSGFTFNVCILATAFDAAARDYRVKFISDLCGTLPAKHADKTYTDEEVHLFTRVISDYAVGEMVNKADVQARL